MKKYIIFALFGFCSFAFAEGRESGGGFGVHLREKFYLYDFVESGIENKVSINTSITDAMNALRVLETSILSMDHKVFELTANKLNEIHNLVPEFADLILGDFKSYQWNIVDPSLIHSDDIGKTPIDVEGSKLRFQWIAFRDDTQKTVSINEGLWNQLSIEHKVGLLFHEVLYAEIHRFTNDQDSSRVRNLNALLFAPNFKFQTYQTLTEKLKIAGIFYEDRAWQNIDQYKLLRSPDFAPKCKTFKMDTYNTINAFAALFSNNYSKMISWSESVFADSNTAPVDSKKRKQNEPLPPQKPQRTPNVWWGDVYSGSWQGVCSWFTYATRFSEPQSLRVPALQVTYIFPSYNFVIPTYFWGGTVDASGCGGINYTSSLKFQVPSEFIENFRSLRAETTPKVDKLIAQNNGEFLDVCLDEQQLKFLATIKNLKFPEEIGN